MAAEGRKYSQRWVEGIVSYQPIAVAYLCINRPICHSQHLSEFTMALLYIFTHTNNFSFLLQCFIHLFQHLINLLYYEQHYYLQKCQLQYLYFHYYYYYYYFLRLRALFWVLWQFIIALTSHTLILDTSRLAEEFIIVLSRAYYEGGFLLRKKINR